MYKLSLKQIQENAFDSLNEIAMYMYTQDVGEEFPKFFQSEEEAQMALNSILEDYCELARDEGDWDVGEFDPELFEYIGRQCFEVSFLEAEKQA